MTARTDMRRCPAQSSADVRTLGAYIYKTAPCCRPQQESASSADSIPVRVIPKQA